MPTPRVPTGLRVALRYALVLTALETLVVVGVTFARRDAELRSFDARLLGIAYDAAERLAHDPAGRVRATVDDAVAQAPDVLYMEVDDGEGRLLASSDAALTAVLPLRGPDTVPVRARFDDVDVPAQPTGSRTPRLARHVALPFHDERGRVHVVHALARTTGGSQLWADLAARLAWLVPLTLGAALVIAWMVERRALAPLHAVAEAAATVTPVTLAKGIQIADAEGEIAHLESALNDALRRLDEAFAAQARFVADVSHELKTPISVLLTQAQVLDARNATPEEVAAFRESVEVEMRRLGATIEAFLALARPGADTSFVLRDPVPLLDVVLEALHHGRRLANRYGVRLVPRIDLHDEAAPPSVRGDPNLLRTMLDNLLANALRYSPRGDAVDVRVATDQTHASVTVRDRGPGIPPGYEERIFDRFQQAPDPSARGGTGLGLHIAAAVARLHGGTISARNRPDAGCEFVVALPLAAAPEGQRQT